MTHNQPCAPYFLVINMNDAQVVTSQEEPCHQNLNKSKEATCENDKEMIDDDNNDDVTKMYVILCCFVVAKCLLCY